VQSKRVIMTNFKTISLDALDTVTGGAQWMRRCFFTKVPKSDVPPGAQDFLPTLKCVRVKVPNSDVPPGAQDLIGGLKR
jgi:hypothetical protein